MSINIVIKDTLWKAKFYSGVAMGILLNELRRAIVCKGGHLKAVSETAHVPSQDTDILPDGVYEYAEFWTETGYFAMDVGKHPTKVSTVEKGSCSWWSWFSNKNTWQERRKHHYPV